MDNAFKFTLKGEIRIDVDVVEDLGRNVKLRFSVTDTGIGIPKEKRETIFESFTQADSSTTRKYGGTGLGTTISKQLAEMMGGEIGVESEAGVGSCFWFTSVFTKDTTQKAITAKKDEKGEVGRMQVAKQRSSLHVLLVEDYPTNQQVAMSHLKIAGYNVDLAENGLDAVELFKKNRYHIILMDIQMPIMDGYEATREIRELESRESHMERGRVISDYRPPMYGNGPEKEAFHHETSIQRVPIIAMTGHAVEGYRKECLEIGMDDYLAKPLTRKHFLAMVDKWTGVSADVQTEDSSGLTITQRDRKTPNESGNFQRPIDPQGDREPPMDFERALSEFEGDKSLLMEVLGGFIQNVRAQIKIIQDALIARNADRVREEAHAIKGGAANLRAERLSRMAFELEHISKSGEMEKGAEAVKNLELELNELDELRSVL